MLSDKSGLSNGSGDTDKSRLSNKPGRSNRSCPNERGFSDTLGANIPELIDKSGIAQLVPHDGAMCLLEYVVSWDAVSIQCTANTHQATDNPLRHAGRLGILCGVEYAAQAIAIHSRLGGGKISGLCNVRVGYLASLRALVCHTDRLDLLPGTLVVEAERLHEDADRAIYSFVLHHADRILLNGRIAVVLAKSEG